MISHKKVHSTPTIMEKDLPKNLSTIELNTLRSAFESFNETTRHLQESYEKLQKQIETLNLELENKNLELKQNLNEKEEVKNYLHYILESLPTGVIVVDHNGIITTFNQAAETITSLPSNKCVSSKLIDTIYNEIIISIVDQMQNGEAIAISEEIQWVANNNKKKIQVTASPLKNPQGYPIGTVLILQDITQLKHLEEEAQRNDRLRAMGEMAAGIAHEIRNPLGGIELFASMLQKDLLEDEDKRPLTEHIISGVKNMDRIISSLLLFAKSPEPSRQQCDINELLKHIFESSTQLSIPKNIKIHFNFKESNVIASGDRGLLEQVFLNFIRNAIQAMPKGGELKIQTDKNYSNLRNIYHRHYVAVTFSDTGVGISTKDQKNIFNPFFTTKDKGTGLGLAIAHNIVKAHQGTIDLESCEGQGATFTVKIPGWEE